MDVDTMLRVCREGMLLVLLLSAGPVLAAMVTGLVISIFQAATQIQEQTLAVVPKIVAVFVVLSILGLWMIGELARFATMLLEAIAGIRG